jgi:hypothetical protein
MVLRILQLTPNPQRSYQEVIRSIGSVLRRKAEISTSLSMENLPAKQLTKRSKMLDHSACSLVLKRRLTLQLKLMRSLIGKSRIKGNPISRRIPGKDNAKKIKPAYRNTYLFLCYFGEDEPSCIIRCVRSSCPACIHGLQA